MATRHLTDTISGKIFTLIESGQFRIFTGTLISASVNCSTGIVMVTFFAETVHSFGVTRVKLFVMVLLTPLSFLSLVFTVLMVSSIRLGPVMAMLSGSARMLPLIRYCFSVMTSTSGIT